MIANFVLQVGKWFWGEYFEKLFFDLSYSLAFTTWVVNNGGIIMFIWFILIVFVNKFKFVGSRKDEDSYIDDIEDNEVLTEE